MKQKELVEFIARSLVDNPDHVSVAEKEGEDETILELTVDKEDIGKIIGRKGRTARAIRTLVGAVSAKTRKRAIFEIAE